MMRRLDRGASALTGGTCATCVYAVIDPGERSCTMSLAGHLSPVLALPDGRTYVPALPAGMPVGLGTGLFGQIRIKLPPGAVLALYTDGLAASWPCAPRSPVSTARWPAPVMRWSTPCSTTTTSP